jgi:hypothetical protein
MARIIKTEKEKKKSKVKVLLSSLVVVLLLVGGGFALWKFVFNADDKVKQEMKEIDKLENYGYVLMDTDTKFFKSEFANLKEIVKSDNVDSKSYSTQVAKMFVIDLYTINTKVNKYDIGGTEYYHVDKKEMFEQKVMDTLYSSLLDNTFGDRKQELPEVSGVEVVSTKEGTFTLNDKKVDSYEVVLTISYVKDLGYDKKVSVVVVQENDTNRWSVVESKPVTTEKK